MLKVSFSKMYIRSLNLITNTETPAACGSDDPTAASEDQSKIIMSPACPGRSFVCLSTPVDKKADNIYSIM